MNFFEFLPRLLDKFDAASDTFLELLNPISHENTTTT